MRRVLAILSIILVTGCASSPQQTEQSFRQEMVAAAQTCRQQYEHDPRVAPVLDKLPFDVSSATSAQRADPGRVSDSEKPAIEAHDEILTRCDDSGIAIWSRYVSSGRVANLLRYLAVKRTLRADLWAGKITFGGFLSKAGDLYQAFIRDDMTIARQEAEGDTQRRRNLCCAAPTSGTDRVGLD